MSVLILTTGGTIDDLEYDTIEGQPEEHQSLIPNLIQRAGLKVACNILELMAKDSRFITDADRFKMMEVCESAEETQIVISHGTLTMVETAKYLGEKRLQKTIVLFGSFIPANKLGSDAPANLDAAITAVQILNHDVYIAMNGKVLLWNKVKKNLDSGSFEMKTD